jgi:hypothetical protein
MRRPHIILGQGSSERHVWLNNSPRERRHDTRDNIIFGLILTVVCLLIYIVRH